MLRTLLVLVAVSSFSAPVLAQGHDVAVTGVPPEGSSYTVEIVIGDAIAGGFFTAAATLGMLCFEATFELFEDNKPDTHPTCTMALFAVAFGSVTFGLTSPIIHIAHERPGPALGAFTLRVVVPAALIGVGIVGDAVGAGVAIGGVAAITGMFIDWFVLSRPAVSPTQARARPIGFGLVAVDAGGGVTLYGQF